LGAHATLTREWISKNYVVQFNTAIPPCRTLYNNPKYTMTGTDRRPGMLLHWLYEQYCHTQLSFTLRVEEPGSPKKYRWNYFAYTPENHNLNMVLSASNMTINRNLTFSWWVLDYLEKLFEVDIHTASHASLLVSDIPVSAFARRHSNNLVQKFSHMIRVYVCPLISGEFFGIASKAPL
jgi:hypothetical protein